jgi:hypothetical protein
MRRAIGFGLLGAITACNGSSAPLGGANMTNPPLSDGGASADDAGLSTGGSSADASLPPADAHAGSEGDGPSSDAAATDGTAPLTEPDGALEALEGGASPSGAFLPPVQGTCPTIATGTLTFAGQQVQIWSGSAAPAQPGPLVIFWFPTSGSSIDAVYFFGQAQIDAVVAAGGIVAAPATSNKQGTDTGNAVWYTGDFDTTDQVVACALQQNRIDPRRIFVTGASAGGLQATWMAYARSGYVAATAPLSGGLAGADGFYAAPTTSPQDPTNVPSSIVTHGAEGSDVYIIDFAVTSAAYEADIASKGGFSVDCNTGGGHVSGPPQICPAIWQFFEDHPFKAKDDYGAGLPSSFPTYCQIGPRAADGGAP